jgi:hypothetical protein
MAEEKAKKPKIDLKARLGKSAVTGSGAAVPHSNSGLPSAPISQPPLSDRAAADRMSGPPSVRPSIPGGIAPPPGIAPPVGLGGYSPFAPKPVPKAAPVSAEAQTIKVELGEEVHEERRRAGKRAVVYALLAAVFAGGASFFIGRMSETSRRQSDAIRGAVALHGDVETANQKMKELDSLLEGASNSLREKKYPGDLVANLAATNVPFDATNLAGKNIGSLPDKTLKMLFQYTKGCEELADKKDSLRNVVGALQKQVETSWAEEKKPTYKLGLVFAGGDGKFKGDMVKFKEPFEVGTWPEKFKVLVPEFRDGKRVETEKEGMRYVKGDLTGSTPIVVPIEPSSVAAYTDERVVQQLNKAMFDVRVIIKGDSSDPQKETKGIEALGQELADSLNQIALKQK